MSIDIKAIYLDLKRLLRLYTKNRDCPNIRKTFLLGNILVDPSASIDNSTLSGTIKIGKEVIIKGCYLHGDIEIGDYTVVESPCNIVATGAPVRVGRFCSFAWDLSIINQNHNFTRPSSHYMGVHVFHREVSNDLQSKGPTEIGHDVWLGAGAFILPGAKIGSGAIIGAGSVVAGEVPPYAIVYGIPAKVMKFRFDPETIERLLQIRWWDWPIERIRRNEEFFMANLNLNKIKE